MEEKNLFERAINELKFKEEINEIDFNMFFSSKSCLFNSMENNIITISVYSNFIKDNIKKYKDKIEQEFKNIINQDISLFINIDEKQFNNESKQETIKETQEENKKTKKVLQRENNLNKDFLFDNYVIGENNEFAVYRSHVIAKNPGKENNPFVIYGGVGLGKTHLMQSIGNEIAKDFPSYKIFYINTCDLLSDFFREIGNKMRNTYDDFEFKYRTADVLLIDDIHLFKGKDTLQDAFFGLFENLKNNKKQMIFTCDRPITELQGFEDRIKSRLGSGMSVDLQPPKFEVRYQILKIKYEKLKITKNIKPEIQLSDEILEIIAENINSNIRDLEAALNIIIGFSDFKNKKLEKNEVKNILIDKYKKSVDQTISVDDVLKVVSKYFNTSISELKGKKRTAGIVYARHIAIYIAKENTQLSTTELGEEFGGKDHSTIMNAISRIAAKIKIDISLRENIEKITTDLLSKK